MKVIEFLGMPRAGKTTQIERLKARLEKAGHRVALLTDRVRAEKIQTPVTEGMAYTLVFFSQAIEFYYEHKDKVDFILIDRGCVDAGVWADVRYKLDLFDQKQALAFQECFAVVAPLVHQVVYFDVSVDTAISRHEQSGEQQSVDDLAMNRKWLEAIHDSYQEHETRFKNALKINGLVSTSETEEKIWRFVA